MPHFIQGAAGKKEAAPHHIVSAKKRIALKTMKHCSFGGRRLITCGF
jgi:hypothetical protein